MFVVIAVLLGVATYAVPRGFLPFYLGGWFLVLVSLNVRYARPEGDRTRDALTVVDAVALFAFVFLAFRAFLGSATVTLVAAIAGVAGVAYSLSL